VLPGLKKQMGPSEEEEPLILHSLSHVQLPALTSDSTQPRAINSGTSIMHAFARFNYSITFLSLY
jgi:hypothetical protein